VSELFLRVPAEPENVIVVREMLRGIDSLLMARAGLSESVQTAVSEAANNVIMHAYQDGPPGPLEVDVSLEGRLEIRVRDQGVGFDPLAEDPDDGSAGFGRAVITAFADEVRVTSAPGAGSEVRLRWGVPPMCPSAGPGHSQPLTGETVLCLRPHSAFSAVTGRVMAALGARSRLPVDRLNDLQLIGDALISHSAPVLCGSHLSFAFLRRPGRLQVSAGPFVLDGAEAVRLARSVEGVPLIDRLADDLEVLRDPGTDQEALVFAIGDVT